MIALACVVIALAVGYPTTAAAQDSNVRAKAVYDRAIRLEGDGNFPAALSLLWEAAGLAPRDADIQNRLGEALERIGALDAAVAAYRHGGSGETALSQGVQQSDPRTREGRERGGSCRTGTRAGVGRSETTPIDTSRWGSRNRNRTSTRRWRAFVARSNSPPATSSRATTSRSR